MGHPTAVSEEPAPSFQSHGGAVRHAAGDSAPVLSTTLLYVARQEEVLKNTQTVLLTEGAKHLL